MKKLSFLVALLAAGLTSCSEGIDEQNAVPAQMQEFTATIASESRTVINDANQVLWEADDLIAIHRANTAVSYQYKVKSGAGTTDAVFGYNSAYATVTATATQNYAVYPYSIVTGAESDGVVSVELPAALDYAEASLANAVMVAASATTDLQFKNTQSLLRFAIASNDPAVTKLLSITVTSAANALTGAATIDLNATEPAVVVDAAGGKSLTLDCGAGLALGTEAVELYLPIAPTEFAANDLTISLETNMGVFEKQFAQVVALGRNKVTTITKTFEIEDFTGSTEGYGEVVELTETEPVALAAELSEVLANPEVGQIVLPELPAGTEVELSNTLTFNGTALASADTSSLPARDLVIDGNGATLVFSGSGSRIIDVTKTCGNISLTLKNMTLVNGLGYIERGVNFNTPGHLTLENVEVKSVENGSITYALNCPSSADNALVEIKNSKLSGCIAVNLWGENMVVNVTNSELYTIDNTDVEGYSVISLNDNGIDAAEYSVVNVEGGKVIAKHVNESDPTPSAAVRNSTYNGEVNISDSTEVQGEIRNGYVAIVYYKGYNEFYSYTDLQAAINKAAENQNAGVRLIRDIEIAQSLTINGNVTLDLNGYDIVGTDKGTASFGLISCNMGSNLTIINSASEESKITLVAENNRGWNAYSSVISNQRATFTVGEGVVIEHLGGTDMAYGIDNLTNTGAEAAIATVDGATIKSTYRAIRQFLNSSAAGVKNDLYVKSGVIEGANKSIWMQDANAKANAGKLVVSEGVQLKGDVLLSVTAGSTSWPVEISVPDSVFTDEYTVLTNANVPEGYSLVNTDGVWTVVAPQE